MSLADPIHHKYTTVELAFEGKVLFRYKTKTSLPNIGEGITLIKRDDANRHTESTAYKVAERYWYYSDLLGPSVEIHLEEYDG